VKLSNIYKQQIAELKNEIMEIHNEINAHIKDIQKIKCKNQEISESGSLLDKIFRKEKSYVDTLSRSKEYYKKELREKLKLLKQLEGGEIKNVVS